jgi:hypothetical protein
LELASGERLISSTSQPVVTAAGPVLAGQLRPKTVLSSISHVLGASATTLARVFAIGGGAEVHSLRLDGESDFYVGSSNPIRVMCKGHHGGGLGCLSSGTPVLVATGGTKPIEMIEAGDIVVGFVADEEIVSRPARVVRRRTSTVETSIRLRLSKGEELVCSLDQPLMTIAGPIGAAQIFRGASFVSSGEPVLERLEILPGTRDVHMLELENHLAFRVGEGAGILAIWKDEP